MASVFDRHFESFEAGLRASLEREWKALDERKRLHRFAHHALEQFRAIRTALAESHIDAALLGAVSLGEINNHERERRRRRQQAHAAAGKRGANIKSAGVKKGIPERVAKYMKKFESSDADGIVKGLALHMGVSERQAQRYIKDFRRRQ